MGLPRKVPLNKGQAPKKKSAKVTVRIEFGSHDGAESDRVIELDLETQKMKFSGEFSQAEISAANEVFGKATSRDYQLNPDEKQGNEDHDEPVEDEDEDDGDDY